MKSPWDDESVAAQQFDLARSQLERPIEEWPAHFHALVEAVKSTQHPGAMVEVGAASGYNLDVLREAGVELGSYSGIDISKSAVKLAEARGIEVSVDEACNLKDREAGIVLDGSCLLHVEKWREHIAHLCRASSRFVILHRVPLAAETRATATHGYGKTFSAWEFAEGDLDQAMEAHGFEGTGAFRADGGSVTLVYARPRHWVTYADRNYLPRLKALHASMKRHCGPFELHVLAWDSLTWYEYARLTTGRYGAMPSGDFLRRHPELEIDKLPGPPRSRVEHFWTCGPRWIADVMEETGEPVTYVDADIMFFSSPEPVFAEIDLAPAAVIPHNFARAADGLPGPVHETHHVFGLYNVGLVYVAEQRIAAEWAAQCREWCADRVEVVPIPERRLRYGDQKYLDRWDSEYGAHVVEHPGACLGPWAIHRLPLTVENGQVLYGGRPLVSYHYSGLRELPDGHNVNTRPKYQVTDEQARIIYAPYWDALEEAKR